MPNTFVALLRGINVDYANGMSGSDTAPRLARLLKTPNTDRNWNTVLRVQAAAKG